MAGVQLFPCLFISVLLLMYSHGAEAKFATIKEPRELKLKQKVTHLQFYFHDIVSGPNSTNVQVAGPTNATGTGFGMIVVIDNPLTEGPEVTSKLVGRAQGIYVSSGQHNVSLLMSMNLAFVEGKYNGSVLSILGKNAASNPVREMPIVGGSGIFRYARGYCLARTHRFWNTGDAIVRYDVYVMHY